MTALDSIRIAPGILRVAVPSDTLPPATSTNAWVLGDKRVVVVDPGGNSPAVCAALADLLALREVLAIVLTHHHSDHIAGVADLVERTGAPVWAHPDTVAMVPFPVARLLRESDVVQTDFGDWNILHTPGHAVGHICLQRDDGHVVVGDLLAGEGTILIAPPEGHLATYLHSLQRVKASGAHTALPAHGPALDAQEVLCGYLDHRSHRTHQVLAKLGSGPARPIELARRIYTELPAAFHPIAAIQLGAHLTWLQEAGRTIARSDGTHQLVEDGL